MTDKELIVAAAQGTAKGIAEAVLEPFHTLTHMFCAEVGEAGGYVGWAVRLKTGLYVMQLAKKMLEAAGRNPQPVLQRLFLSIMDRASIEDDAYLQKQWAGLLANAANAGPSPTISSYFPDLLAQLSPSDAMLLDKMYDLAVSAEQRYAAKGKAILLTNISQGDEAEIRRLTEIPDAGQPRDADPFVLGLENLLRLGLLERRMKHWKTGPPIEPTKIKLPDGKEKLKYPDPPQGTINPDDLMENHITALGYRLVAACRPPRPAAANAR